MVELYNYTLSDWGHLIPYLNRQALRERSCFSKISRLGPAIERISLVPRAPEKAWERG